MRLKIQFGRFQSIFVPDSVFVLRFIKEDVFYDVSDVTVPFSLQYENNCCNHKTILMLMVTSSTKEVFLIHIYHVIGDV